MPSIRINGEERRLDAAITTLAALVTELGLTGKRIAIERNGEIVPRSMHASVMLQPGDQIEIVVAVGGG